MSGTVEKRSVKEQSIYHLALPKNPVILESYKTLNTMVLGEGLFQPTWMQMNGQKIGRKGGQEDR